MLHRTGAARGDHASQLPVPMRQKPAANRQRHAAQYQQFIADYQAGQHYESQAAEHQHGAGCDAADTPYRLPSALMRFDAEWFYSQAVQQGVLDRVLNGWSKGEPFPCIAVIRPKQQTRK